LCAAAGGFSYSFSNLAAYDDEGTLMMILHRFLGGEPLYDRVWTIYGPVYYFYEWAAHAVAGVPLSHDSVRFVSLFFWIATAVLLYLFVQRVTGSLLLSVSAFCVGFRVLRFIGAEPAHPQELCALLLVGMAAAACYRGRPGARMAILGALAGLLLMVKINLGIFVGIALALAWAYGAATPPVLLGAISGAALVFPVVLLRPHLHEEWAQVFGAVVVLSLAAAMLASRRLRIAGKAGWSGAGWAISGFAAAVAFGCFFAVLRGSTLAAMFQRMVVDPATMFVGLWYWPTRIRLISLPWAAAGLGLAWYADRKKLPTAWLAALKIGLGLGSALVAIGNLGNDLLGFGLPFQWLILIPPERAETRLSGFARVFLAFVSVLQSLYVFPVAGSQVWLASIVPLAVGVLCIADGMADVEFRPRSLAVRCCILLAALLAGNAWWNVREYRSLTPLGLAGSSYLRLPAPRVATLRALAGDIAANCGTLVTIPAMASFNLWTGAKQPPDLAFVNWMMSVDDAKQQNLARELAATPRVCVLQNAGLASFWTHGADFSNRPLVRFLRENLRPALARDGYEVLR
jgi:hypothetical protein